MSNTGLEGVVVAQTKLSAINGEKGELIYVGRVGTKSLRLNFEVRRNGDSSIVAEAHFVLVAVRRNTFDSVPVPLASGLVAISALLGYVRRHDYTVFVVYRIVVGAIVLAVIASGARSAGY